jgi:signal transduction histidine kinase
MASQLRLSLNHLTLLQKFMLTGLFILLAGMIGIGAWVGKQIETGMIHNTGATSALYVDSFISPHLQELGTAPALQLEHIEVLDSLLNDTPMGQQIVAFKLWDPSGRVIYSTDRSTIGQVFPLGEGLERAGQGFVSSEISSLSAEENAALGARYDRLLETYSPVWLSGTDRIIAVAEFYQTVDALEREIAAARQRSWLVVGLSVLIMYLLLSGFVSRAGDTIQSQQVELSEKVTQLTELLDQNRELDERVRRAAARIATLNESIFRRIGAELHDGPAQDLGLSLLKLDAVIGQLEGEKNDGANLIAIEQLEAIQGSLQNALKDVRATASGLSLPQLSELTLSETVVRAVRAHERRTGTKVELSISDAPAQPPLPVKITAYRLVQEALSNAYRHAGGAGQAVRVAQDRHFLTLEVSDEGSGFEPQMIDQANGHLGINGMRERVESLGGTFAIESRPGAGACVRARLPVQVEGEPHD